jgi:hypothetical protein
MLRVQSTDFMTVFPDPFFPTLSSPTNFTLPLFQHTIFRFVQTSAGMKPKVEKTDGGWKLDGNKLWVMVDP